MFAQNANHEATVTQTGDTNDAKIDQVGEGNVATQIQTENDNTAVATQIFGASDNIVR